MLKVLALIPSTTQRRKQTNKQTTKPGGQQVPLRMWSRSEFLKINALNITVMFFILRKCPFSSA